MKRNKAQAVAPPRPNPGLGGIWSTPWLERPSQIDESDTLGCANCGKKRPVMATALNDSFCSRHCAETFNGVVLIERPERDYITVPVDPHGERGDSYIDYSKPARIPSEQGRHTAASRERRLLQQAARDIIQDPVAKQRERSQRAYRRNPEGKRARQRAYSRRPDVQARVKSWGQNYRARPDVRERQRAYNRAYYQQHRARLLVAAKAHAQQPDVRAKKLTYWRERYQQHVQAQVG